LNKRQRETIKLAKIILNNSIKKLSFVVSFSSF
jgi:hypothetical protein